MAQRQNAEPQRPKPRLTLVTPKLEDTDAFARQLADALCDADVAAVLLRLKPADERTLVNRIKSLAPIAQGRDAALILDGQAGIALRGGADGAQLTGLSDFEAAVGTLKPARIAGCGGLTTRHDAMTAAERGADYVMFGEPHDGRRPSFDAILDRIAWWAEVFAVPCVGYAAALREVGPLVRAGADFVALGDEIWAGSQDGAATVAEAARLLIAPETVA